MHGDVFAEDVVVADTQTGRLVAVFQILRRVADDAAGVEAISRADGRQPREINVRTDDAARAEFHAFVNYGAGANADGGIQFGVRVDDGGRVNHARGEI